MNMYQIEEAKKLQAWQDALRAEGFKIEIDLSHGRDYFILFNKTRIYVRYNDYQKIFSFFLLSEEQQDLGTYTRTLDQIKEKIGPEPDKVHKANKTRIEKWMNYLVLLDTEIKNYHKKRTEERKEELENILKLGGKKAPHSQDIYYVKTKIFDLTYDMRNFEYTSKQLTLNTYGSNLSNEDIIILAREAGL